AASTMVGSAGSAFAGKGLRGSLGVMWDASKAKLKLTGTNPAEATWAGANPVSFPKGTPALGLSVSLGTARGIIGTAKGIAGAGRLFATTFAQEIQHAGGIGVRNVAQVAAISALKTGKQLAASALGAIRGAAGAMFGSVFN